jgi:N,N'-diacetyllegionaminate synthase
MGFVFGGRDMKKKPVYIIAEAGVNHNGRLDLALELVKIAKDSGADAVKFQTFKTEETLTVSASKAEYQVNQTGDEDNQFQMIKRLELSFDHFKLIKDCCDRYGIDFLSTGDDLDSLNFLCDELKIKKIKIGSGEITNLGFIAEAAKKKIEIILSTGMCSLGEVEVAVELIRSISKEKLTILHCTSSYPCPYEDANLTAMLTLKAAFGSDVGYSDHTLGRDISVAAVAMGATIVEKHFTVDTSLPGPDHAASLAPAALTSMVQAIRNVEAAMGDGLKKPTSDELKTRRCVRKKVVAGRKITKGDVVTLKDVAFKRCDFGIPAESVSLYINKKINITIEKDIPVEVTMFDYLG